MRIIFVCTGNTCRSPMAESYAKARFKDKDIVFESRGVMAGDTTINDRSAAIIDRENLERPSAPHQLTAADTADSLLLVMTASHKDVVGRQFPEADVRMISEYAGEGVEDVMDPYGGTMDDYEVTFVQLKKFIDEFDL
ncbi:low molecular weight phosphatase family protein [Salinicoccus siamensis]|uniref:Low molecular weight protein-tyrosine-phosphatase PtpB n=1 Tax=Salinicoccus siamensis TaxID=381830 RepID=A0ABV5Z3Z5_9STAP